MLHTETGHGINKVQSEIHEAESLPNTNAKDNSIQANASADTTQPSTLARVPPSTICYSRAFILFLARSPLVCIPENMPAFKDWFG